MDVMHYLQLRACIHWKYFLRSLIKIVDPSFLQIIGQLCATFKAASMSYNPLVYLKKNTFLSFLSFWILIIICELLQPGADFNLMNRFTIKIPFC